MSQTDDRLPFAHLRHDLAALRGNWVWFLLLGVVLIVLGLIALSALWVASLATALAIGPLLLVGGVAEVVGAFCRRGWSGFFLHLLSGVLSLVIGELFLRVPVTLLSPAS